MHPQDDNHEREDDPDILRDRHWDSVPDRYSAKLRRDDRPGTYRREHDLPVPSRRN